MTQDAHQGFFLVKTLARFAFVALILASAAAQAQPRPTIDHAPRHGGQGNDFNWMQSGGGN